MNNSLFMTGLWIMAAFGATPPPALQETAGETHLVIQLKDGRTVRYPLSQVESLRFETGTGTDATRREAVATAPGGEAIAPLRLLRGAGSLGGGWGDRNLVDGAAATGWSSRPNSGFPQEFIIEFPRPSTVGFVEADNGTQESSYPGVSAREVILLGSNVGPSGPYVNLATVALSRGINGQRFPAGPATVRWVRVVIRSNYGHPNYTQLMDLRFYPPQRPGQP